MRRATRSCRPVRRLPWAACAARALPAEPHAANTAAPQLDVIDAEPQRDDAYMVAGHPSELTP
jgi:hypothetical protein